MTRLLVAGEPTRLGTADAPLGFSPPNPRPGVFADPRRLQLDGADAFKLSYWCGTCPLVFERLAGSNRTLSSEALQDALNAGITSLDPVVLETASELIPQGEYLPMLLEVRPRLVAPANEGDYFTEEQIEHRGVDGFWGLPENPRTKYYRAGRWNRAGHLSTFEFIVPMVPPSWNDPARVRSYQDQLAAGGRPTVLALSILDVTQPYDSVEAHSGLIHFVLDGHHKLEAAADAGEPVTLLTLLSLDQSLARDVLDELPAELRS